MPTRRPKTKTTQVRIIMEQPFRTFGPELRKRFVTDLATLTGATIEEIQEVSFGKGCVVFKGRLPWPAALRLDELSGSHATPLASEKKALTDFMVAHNITKIVVGPGHNLVAAPDRTKKRSQKDLVFVHGWRGDEQSFALLPQWMEDEFKCRSLVYPYPTGLVSHSPSLVYIGRNLDNWLRNREPAPTLAIIGHSYGGLVARKFIVLQRSRSQPLDSSLVQSIFVASPHNGAALAKAAKITGWNSEQVRELSPDSPILFELNEEWQHWVTTNRDSCGVRSIFGTADRIVDAASAQGLDPEAVPIAGANHTEIVRPALRTDEIVRTLIRLLNEAGFGEEGGERQKRAVGGKAT